MLLKSLDKKSPKIIIDFIKKKRSRLIITSLILISITTIANYFLDKNPLISIIIYSSLILLSVSVYKKIYGYIIREHILPFFLSIAIMISILLAQFLIKNIDKFLGKGLEIGVLFKMVYYNMAWVLALAVPMAILLCTLMAFGRLSSDNEITAMKASGIKYSSLLIPPLIFGTLVTITMIYFNNWVLPDMNYEARNLISNISKKNPSIIFEPKQLNSQVDGYNIYFDSLEEDPEKNDGEEGKLYFKDAHINKYDKRGIISTHISKKAYTKNNYNDDIVLVMEDGINYEEPDIDQFQTTEFSNEQITLDVNEFSFTKTKYRGQRELTFDSIQSRITYIDKKIYGYNDRIKNLVKKFDPDAIVNSTDDAERLIKNKINSLKLAEAKYFRNKTQTPFERDKKMIQEKTKKKNELLVEMHKKFSLPIACIVFILIGAPLGIVTRKGKFSVSMAMSLAFFLIYWAFLIAGENFADKGSINPALSMWLPNIILFIIGIYLNIKISRGQKIFTLPTLSFLKNPVKND